MVPGPGGLLLKFFMFAYWSWRSYAQILIYGPGRVLLKFSFMVTGPGVDMLKFLFMLTDSTTSLFNYHTFKIVKMGRKKGQKLIIKKGKAALHLEQHWSFNFDDVSEDSLITKGNVLYYLIENTIVNLTDKLMPLLKTGTRKSLYGRAHHLHQLHTKKNYGNLDVECNMNTFDKFCQEPFIVNLPSEEMAIVPQMMQTEDTTEAANEATQVRTNAVIASSTPMKTRNHDVEMLSRSQRKVVVDQRLLLRSLRMEINSLKSMPYEKKLRNLSVSELT